RGGAGDRRVRRGGGEGARAAGGRRGVVPAACRSGRRGGALRRSERRRGRRRVRSREARWTVGREPARSARPPQGGPDAAGVPASARDGEETSSGLNSLDRVPGTVYALANQKGGVGKTTT